MGYHDDKMIKNLLIATMTMTATTTRTPKKATGLNKYINNNNNFARASRFFLNNNSWAPKVLTSYLPMCIIWPALLSIKLPLCLSFICSRKLTIEYAAMLLIKFARAWNIQSAISHREHVNRFLSIFSNTLLQYTENLTCWKAEELSSPYVFW